MEILLPRVNIFSLDGNPVLSSDGGHTNDIAPGTNNSRGDFSGETTSPAQHVADGDDYMDGDGISVDGTIGNPPRPSCPVVFGSDNFNSILHHLQAMAKDSSERWALQDQSHLEYLSHFRTIDTSLEGHTTLTTSVVEHIEGLRVILALPPPLPKKPSTLPRPHVPTSTHQLRT